jgi:hypothetical protein
MKQNNFPLFCSKATLHLEPGSRRLKFIFSFVSQEKFRITHSSLNAHTWSDILNSANLSSDSDATLGASCHKIFITQEVKVCAADKLYALWQVYLMDNIASERKNEAVR